MCGGDQGQVQSAVSVGRARENVTGTQALSAIAFPERLKIFERFAPGEKCYWISLAGGEKEVGGACTGRGEKINACICVCLCCVCLCCVCVVCVCVHPCMFVYH